MAAILSRPQCVKYTTHYPEAQLLYRGFLHLTGWKLFEYESTIDYMPYTFLIFLYKSNIQLFKHIAATIDQATCVTTRSSLVAPIVWLTFMHFGVSEEYIATFQTPN